jgi:hypothetical protein
MIEIIGHALSQWDVGRSVQITGIEAEYAHFANNGDSKAVIMGLVDSEAKIPDYLLQTGKQLCVYAVKGGITVESKTFYVQKRERPENYVYEDDQRNYIYELISSAQEAISELQSAMEAGYFVGPQGPAGEPGYTPVKGVDYFTPDEKAEFALAGLTSGYVSVSTEDELTAGLNNIYHAMKDGDTKIFRLSVNVATLSISGGTWFVTVYRTASQHGYALAVRYGVSGGLIFTNNLIQGEWSGWTNISPSQYFPLAGGTISGDVTFKGNVILQKTDNGRGLVYKNHSSTSDFGTQLNDYAQNGDYVSFQLRAKTQEINLLTKAGGVSNNYAVLHTGNMHLYGIGVVPATVE